MTEALYLNGILQVKGYRAVQNRVADIVRGFGLGTTTEWFILCHTHYSKQTRAVDVANLLEVEPPLITNLSDNLEAKGLLRKAPHATDKRVKLLELTTEGKALVPKVEKALQKALDNLLNGLSPSQTSAYRKVLETIVKNSKAG